MPVTVTLDGPRFSEIPLSTQDLMREVGLLARERILLRVARSEAVDGSPFAPYSAEYAKRKAAEVGAGPVNLQLSGRMLQGIVLTEITENSVTLGFSS